jgi:hypothetical protein
MNIQTLIVAALALLSAAHFLHEAVGSFRWSPGCPGGACAKCPAQSASHPTATSKAEPFSSRGHSGLR